MSLEKFYAIVCDGCGASRRDNLFNTPHKTRSMAGRVGWERIDIGERGQIKNADFCPKCAPIEKALLREMAKELP